MSIQVQSISKTFGAYRALDDVSLSVGTGELVALLGPSGSGKTTLLRIIAGLEAPDAGSGEIRFHDEDVSRRHVGKRNVGFVFQHYALFRHMTVFENVAFGLRVRPFRLRPSRAAIREKVMSLLSLVQLDRLESRYPSQLSGGQRQRIALARALAVEPRVLLLDEPFGALDARVRSELRRWLRRLHDEVHITSVFVTHDQEEALEVADRIAVLNQGRIEQVGTPEEVYEKPASPFVYHFLGNVNLFHGRVEGGQVRLAQGSIRASAVERAGADDTVAVADDADSVAYVRPHEMQIVLQDTGDADFSGTIEQIGFAGPVVRVYVRRNGDQPNADAVEVAVPYEEYRSLGVKQGDKIFVKVRRARVFVEDYSI